VITAYTPKPDALDGRVCKWLKSHPREELDSTDMYKKFNVSKAQADKGLAEAIGAGLIEVANDGTGVRIWKAGPKLREAEDKVPGLSDIGRMVAPPKKRTYKALPAIDVTKLVVKTGVPIPATKRIGQAGGKYDELFGLLTKPGQMVEIEPSYTGALRSAAKKFSKVNGVTLVVKITPDQKAGIWRTK
jgi:hypothetical protein